MEVRLFVFRNVWIASFINQWRTHLITNSYTSWLLSTSLIHQRCVERLMPPRQFALLMPIPNTN